MTSFEMKFVFDQARDLERLKGLSTPSGRELIPNDVNLKAATLTVTSKWIQLRVSYYGNEKDGTEHERQKTDVHYFPAGRTDINWIWHLLGDAIPQDQRLALEQVWPKDPAEEAARKTEWAARVAAAEGEDE